MKNVWNEEKIIKEAKKYKRRSDFKKNCVGGYFFSQRNGLLESVCKHMKGSNRKPVDSIWDKKSVLQEAKKYKRRSDFKKNCVGGYSFAQRNGLLESVCKHMDSIINWDKEKVIKEAKKYKTRVEFYNKSGGAYKFAQRNNLLDIVCKDMKCTIELREKRYTKNILVPKIKHFLKRNKINFKIELEFNLHNIDSVGGRIDIVILLNDYNVMLPIEVKHDGSFWSKKHIKEQVQRYNKAFCNIKGFHKTILVSPSGRYGLSEKDFFISLKKVINHV